jgi:hypothetical protein
MLLNVLNAFIIHFNLFEKKNRKALKERHAKMFENIEISVVYIRFHPVAAFNSVTKKHEKL